MKMNNSGFTLAEVLITLSIIGIVAAMNIPTLIQKNQDKELISLTKKFYADINNSLLLVQKDYGVVGDNSYLFNANDNNAVVANNWAKYFKGSKVCTSSSGKCKPSVYDIKYAVPQTNSEGNAKVVSSTAQGPRIILSNGAIISVVTNKSGCEPKQYTGTHTDSFGRPLTNADGTPQKFTYTSDICANVVFDVNGPKKPNQYGRDVYYFYVFKNKLKYNSASEYGGKSFGNILTGKDKLEYKNYSKGQQIN